MTLRVAYTGSRADGAGELGKWLIDHEPIANTELIWSSWKGDGALAAVIQAAS